MIKEKKIFVEIAKLILKDYEFILILNSSNISCYGTLLPIALMRSYGI